MLLKSHDGIKHAGLSGTMFLSTMPNSRGCYAPAAMISTIEESLCMLGKEGLLRCAGGEDVECRPDGGGDFGTATELQRCPVGGGWSWVVNGRRRVVVGGGEGVYALPCTFSTRLHI